MSYNQLGTATGNATSLAAEVAALGSVVSTIWVTQQQDITGNLSIPANITLAFVAPGKLNISVSVVVTIVGVIQAPPGLNIFTGAGTVSFAANRTMVEYSTSWWIPASLNDASATVTAYLNAIFVAIPQNSTVITPNGVRYRIDTMVEITLKHNVIWKSSYNTVQFSPSASNTYLIWYGASNAEAMVKLYSCFGCVMDGISLQAARAGNPTGSNRGFKIDAPLAGPLSSQNVIRNCTIIGGDTNASFACISNGESTTSNSEFMTFENIFMICALGTNLLLRGSENAHGHVIRDCLFGGTGGQYDIDSDIGGFKMEGRNVTASNGMVGIININLQGSYPTVIDYFDHEGSSPFMFFNGSNGSCVVENCRLVGNGAAGLGLFTFGSGARYITIRNNCFGGNLAAGAFVFDLTGTASGTRILFENNRYDNTIVTADRIHGTPTAAMTVFDSTAGDQYAGGIYQFGDADSGVQGGSFFSSIIAQDPGAALTVSSNTIAPLKNTHQVGAGLIKTITVGDAFVLGGSFIAIPTAAFTTDLTGNVGRAITAVVGSPITFTYLPATSTWYPSAA